MNTFFVGVFRCMLATLCVFEALQQSESKIVCETEPDNPTIVLLGVNSSEVSLKWLKCKEDAGETIDSYFFKRQIPDAPAEQIASRTSSGSFTMIEPFGNKKKYEAVLDQELKLYNVQRDEEYLYILEIVYKTAGGSSAGQEVFQVTVDVKVPPKITQMVPANRRPEFIIEENATLTCNASGDPHPNIIWTKDGVSEDQFNASSYVLHFVDVQRKDAGSYRCTASNGFGSANSVSIVGIKCTGSDCKDDDVGILLRNEDWKSAYGIVGSVEFKDLESKLLTEIWRIYTKNSAEQLYRATAVNFRKGGSVFATLQLRYKNAKSFNDLLKPLETAVGTGKLGPWTVDRKLVPNPTIPPTADTTVSTSVGTKEQATSGQRGGNGGLTNSEMWGIIGGCIAFVLLIVIIILICCICKKKKSSGASKGGKSYTEADGYRMNRQPPPSGLGTASPAYVEARQYAPVSAARKQDEKPPLNYADLSFNNSSAPGRQPPRYPGTEYSEMSPEKRPPPAGGQQGEGGGFELWC